jgi:hypothetical protein
MHTKGPWTYYQNKTGETARIDANDGGLVVGSTVGDTAEECLANARLIAAAPDLLDYLVDARRRLEYLLDTDCECDNTHVANDTSCCLCQYNAAIAKAKGETQC